MSVQGLAMTKEKTYLVCTNSNCPSVSRTTVHYHNDEDGDGEGVWICSVCGSRKRKFRKGRYPPDHDG